MTTSTDHQFSVASKEKPVKISRWNRAGGRPISLDSIMPCSWDTLLEKEHLTEEEAICNVRVRMWVQRNHRSHFVPTEVLRVMNLEPAQ